MIFVLDLEEAIVLNHDLDAKSLKIILTEYRKLLDFFFFLHDSGVVSFRVKKMSAKVLSWIVQSGTGNYCPNHFRLILAKFIELNPYESAQTFLILKAWTVRPVRCSLAMGESRVRSCECQGSQNDYLNRKPSAFAIIGFRKLRYKIGLNCFQ